MSCPTRSDGSSFGAFTGLTSLEISRPGAASPALTRLPALPTSVRNLSVTAGRIANFDNQAKLLALESLHVQRSTVANLGLLVARKSGASSATTSPDLPAMSRSSEGALAYSLEWSGGAVPAPCPAITSGV